MGRPRIELDYGLVYELAQIHCTDEEIATIVGMSIDGFNTRKKRDKQLTQALQKGRANGKSSLRRSQYREAMGGDSTMLVWLGKNYLGQKNNPDLEVAGEGCLNQLVQILSGIRIEPVEDFPEDDSLPN